MAPSRQAVEEWLERVDEITASVHEILNEDPMEAAQRQREREIKRREAEISERREKVKMRYDPRYYARFENDELIDKLLKEADGVRGGARQTHGNEALYTQAERVSLEEALRLKEEAAKAVRASEWERARELYTSAVVLSTVDPKLHRTLRNNRALVQLKLKNFLDVVDDTSYVLKEEPTNVKALLRRATALRQLRRPLDALKDAEAALQREPASREAEELAHWLRRAKREHGFCAAFQHHHPEEAKRLEGAVNTLNTAVTLLREACATHVEDGFTKREGDRDTGAIIQAAEGVRQCVEIVRSFHRGASVLFTLLGGMNPLIDLVVFLLSSGCLELVGPQNGVLLEQMSARGMTFVISARLLALIFLESETGTEELEPSASHLGKGLADVLADAMQQEWSAKQEGTVMTLLEAIMRALEGLVVRFPVQTYAHCASTVIAAWNFMTHRQPTPSLLFFYCGVLEAFLKEPSVVVKMIRDMHGELLPHIIEKAIAMGPMQLKEVALSLAVRATCVNSTWARAMGSPEFTCMFANVLLPSRKGYQDSLSPRAEEGLYAVVYNIFLQVESRSQYVAQWRASMDLRNNDVFSLYTWRTLTERVLSAAKSATRVTVCPKMMGVVTKFFPHDETLQSAMLEGEETLWTILRAALPERWSVAGTGSLTVTDDADVALKENAEEDEEAVTADSSAWELVEHATTCLASLYSRNLLLREEGLVAAGRVAVLLRVVAAARERHVVALGNAALVGSFVPAAGLGHYATLHGVDVFLGALRRVRGFLFSLEHDGKRGSAQWAHAAVAQKNLAIALSNCCTVESQRERMRELKGFETLHAVIEQKAA